MFRVTVIAAVVASLVSGCGGGGEGLAGAQPPVGAGTTTPAYSEPVNSSLQTIVEAALADAARHTGRGRDELRVESAEAVTWGDGSLGCPQPGMGYTQALVPGYRVRIRAGGELLDYHASSRGTLVLCPPGRAVDPLPDQRT